MKGRRREASVQAKIRRKNDPKQIALKEKLKKDRQEASKLAKEQRKAKAETTKKADRAGKHARLKAYIRGGGTD
jgi:hypothetical protein